MGHFPTDIVAEILPLLPAKSLLRFRCVSKPWCALIDSVDFIKLHLKKSKDNRNLILRDDRTLHSVPIDGDDSLYVPVELDHPFKKICTNTFVRVVLGSCDGLVLVLCDSRRCQLAIWNPSTRKYQTLPISPISRTETPKLAEFNVHGIGYDSVHDDYKVVKLTQFSNILTGLVRISEAYSHCETMVYSLKSNSWRRIQDFPYLFRYNLSHATLTGALHWIVRLNFDVPHSDPSIAAFDLATEEYRLVPSPPFVVKVKSDMSIRLAVLEGCLCMVCSHRDGQFDVWVMKDYGVRESWTMLLSVVEPRDIKSLWSVIPLAFSKDRTKVLLVHDNIKLSWFDLKRNAVETFKVWGSAKYCEAVLYAQSLITLETMKQHGEENKDKKPEEKRWFSVRAFKSWLFRQVKEVR